MFGYLQTVNKLGESSSKFYIGQVILAFAHIHSKGYVYRDLKPENILFDNEGYIKITDFGFAKIVSGRTYTMCGTPDYLAPEIIEGKGHDFGVDWWAVGVLIYEMLSGYSPFYHDNQMTQFKLISRGRYRVPSHFSPTAVELIDGFLCKSTVRLGAVQGGVSKIKQHAWFEGMDWDKLLKKEYPAPMVPKVSDPLDLTNYEGINDEFHEMKYRPREGDDWDTHF